MTAPDLPQLRRRIAETTVWCAQRARLDDPENSLRTPTLRPANRDAEPNQWGTFDYTWQTPEDPEVAVRSAAALAQRRAELLDADDANGVAWPDDLAGGRLLLCDPEDSDQCGLSEPESGGFIDTVDVPAWDTWIAYLREDRYLSAEDAGSPPNSYAGRRTVGYLLCWIPPGFISLVEQGIVVNPVECFFWAHEYRRHGYDTDTLRQLDAAGLLN